MLVKNLLPLHQIGQHTSVLVNGPSSSTFRHKSFALFTSWLIPTQKKLFIFFVHRLAYNTRAKNKKTNPSCCFICGKGKLIHFVEIDRILPFRGQSNVRDRQEVSIENLGNGLFEGTWLTCLPEKTRYKSASGEASV